MRAFVEQTGQLARMELNTALGQPNVGGRSIKSTLNATAKTKADASQCFLEMGSTRAPAKY
jgi:hypothetical protein